MTQSQNVLQAAATHVHGVRPVRLVAAAGWGYLPLLGITSASALLLIALANAGARSGAEWAAPLLWGGMVLLLLPVALRLIAQSTPRHERVALAALLGLALYLVKVIRSPMAFTFYDEFVHWQTVDDILRSYHLFHGNPLIPVSPLYPGLHIVTTAIVTLTGLDVFTSGVIALGVARLLLCLALFLFYERVSGSARSAGIAVLLYAGNSNFTFFLSQFAYESLSLPLAVFVLCAVADRAFARRIKYVKGLELAIIAAIVAVVATHHLTSFALVVFLGFFPALCVVWKGVYPLVFRLVTLRKPPEKSLRRTLINALGALNETVRWERPGLGIMALLTLVVTVAWMVYIATPTVGYLEPVFSAGIRDLLRFVAGEAVGRQLFESSSGQAAPLWEQLITYGSIVIILLGLALGIYQLVVKRYRSPFAYMLALGALAYPAMLAFRLTPHGWEISNRASEFLFVGVAFVLAVGISRVGNTPRVHRVWVAICAVCATVIFMGGLVAGFPSWARLPGPYLVGGDARSIEPQGIRTAQWAYDHLGSDNRMGADRINGLLMGSYGNQRMITGVSDQIFLGPVFFSPQMTRREQNLLIIGQVRYLVADTRLSTAPPMFGIYVENGEPGITERDKPLPLAALTKFDTLPYVSRLYDSGDISIYDVRSLSYVP
jgi:hypothetical protein